MNLRNLATISISVLLSVVASLGTVGWFSRHATNGVVRTRRLEIVDDHNKARCTIDTIQVDGHEVPRLTFKDAVGRPIVILNINYNDEGTLFFNSRDKEGKIAIGYLSGSDVFSYKSRSATTDGDPTGAWGINILGTGKQTTGVGIFNTGSVFEPVRTNPQVQ